MWPALSEMQVMRHAHLHANSPYACWTERCVMRLDAALQIIAHKAKGDSGSTKQPSKSGPATKKRKAALEDEDEGEEPASKSKAEPRTSKTIEKVKCICKAATIKIPPSMYVKSKSLTEVEADMQALLAKHELSLDSSTHDISKAAAR